MIFSTFFEELPSWWCPAILTSLIVEEPQAVGAEGSQVSSVKSVVQNNLLKGNIHSNSSCWGQKQKRNWERNKWLQEDSSSLSSLSFLLVFSQSGAETARLPRKWWLRDDAQRWSSWWWETGQKKKKFAGFLEINCLVSLPSCGWRSRRLWRTSLIGDHEQVLKLIWVCFSLFFSWSPFFENKISLKNGAARMLSLSCYVPFHPTDECLLWWVYAQLLLLYDVLLRTHVHDSLHSVVSPMNVIKLCSFYLLLFYPSNYIRSETKLLMTLLLYAALLVSLSFDQRLLPFYELLFYATIPFIPHLLLGLSFPRNPFW